LAPQEAFRVWLVDQKSFSVVRSDISVAYDLAGGVSGAVLWPYTLRKEGQEGGSITWLNAGILGDPWNPVGGSNWIYDMQAIRPLGDWGIVPDPFTGLAWPQRIERAEVVAQTGTPMAQTLDWVTLEFQDEIQVPDDAWVDWDATEQRFLTAGEVYTQPVTARVKSVVYYPEDLYDTVKWHDGSSFDLADIVMGLIMTFDRAKPESPIYDEDYVPDFESFMSVFKGVRIVSEDPLVIEYYTDAFELDAERTVVSLWPQYDFGEGSWDMIGLGVLAESNQELAFTANKADALEIEWMSYIAGPSLEILAKYLDQAAAENYIPYANTLGQYVTEEEAAERWANYKAWYDQMGHFWIGTGPFYLDKVFPLEHTVTIKRFEDYPDPADKWLRFGEPKLAEVVIEGPARVSAADGASFDIMVTFKGEAYPADEIAAVKYLLFDAEGNVAATGDANLVADGHYVVEFTPEQLGELGVGAVRLEIAVTSNVISIPTLQSTEFLLLP
ncbi:MAG TPA: ABC transporter substrate-binding protein, partial [Anaerolineae bacterium]|nr:ABC transporter substrate-binding protein [Anaerolineae bacterium]